MENAGDGAGLENAGDGVGLENAGDGAGFENAGDRAGFRRCRVRGFGEAEFVSLARERMRTGDDADTVKWASADALVGGCAGWESRLRARFPSMCLLGPLPFLNHPAWLPPCLAPTLLNAQPCRPCAH